MYELVPFTSSPQSEKIKIRGEVFKDKSHLKMRFVVEDKNSSIYFEELDRKLNKNESRVHELWKTTCFEAFFGIKGSEEYWELNISPNGRWNLYYFNSYRNLSKKTSEKEDEISEENRISEIPFQMERGIEGFFSLEIKVPLKLLNLDTKKLEVSLTSVIEFKDKEKAYFAIKHVGGKPDFHQRETFICNLE